MKLKEELMRKDIEINKLTMEFNFKLSEEIQKKSDIKNENKLLTDKLDKVRDKYEEKFRVMEGRIVYLNLKKISRRTL